MKKLNSKYLAHSRDSLNICFWMNDWINESLIPKELMFVYIKTGKGKTTLHILETFRWSWELVSIEMILEKTILCQNLMGEWDEESPVTPSFLPVPVPCNNEAQNLRVWGILLGTVSGYGHNEKALLWVSENWVRQKLPVRKNLETFTKFWLLIWNLCHLNVYWE